ncbi:hypothetical protein OAJ52_04200 [Bacteroidia bacterium]|nr:hypothetical protein [Bacteroidia bacterium]
MNLNIGIRKSLFLLISLFMSSVLTAQDDRSDESEKLKKWHIQTNQILILPMVDATLIDDLSFKRYIKVNKNDLKYLKVSLPQYVVIDNKEIDRSNIKKVNKRQAFLDRNGIYDSNRKLRSGISLSNLKLDFGKEFYVTMGGDNGSSRTWSRNGSSMSNIDGLKYENFIITDTVLQLFTNKDDTKQYLACIINTKNKANSSFYGLISAEDFKKPYEDRLAFHNKNERILAEKRMANNKANSETWFSGYYSNIFPDDKLYVYEVAFSKHPRYEKEHVHVKDSMIVNTYSVSNIKPNEIKNSDFQVDTSVSYRLNYLSHNFVKAFNVFELIENERTFLDSVYGIVERPISYSYWRENEDQDPLFDNEKNEIYKNISNHLKYNLDHYRKKMNVGYSPAKLSASLYFSMPNKRLTCGPYLWSNSPVTFKLGIDFSGDYNGDATSEYSPGYKYRGAIGYKHLDIIADDANNYEFESWRIIEKQRVMGQNGERVDSCTYGDELTIEKGLINGINLTGKSAKHNKSGYDVRVDDIKNAFKFTFTDPDFITAEVSSSRATVLEKNSRVYYEETVDFVGSREYNIAKDSKTKEYKQQLVKKYGSRFTEKAMSGEIIVGMPEGLLPIPLQFWNVEDNVTWGNGYRIYCSLIFDVSNRLSVTVLNGKVSSVSTW